MDLIFLEPVFKEKIWGGNRLKEEFNMDTPSEKTGEAWIISAHKNGVSVVKSPEKYKGMKFDDLYKQHKEIFGNVSEQTFPLLVKLLDASENLSVQVHPDNEYARINEGEGELGKTECWYIVSAEENAEIIYGHNAVTKEEFMKSIEDGKWNELLRSVKVRKGDFFDVPYGTVHAIGKGIVILETQQSSDTTYRLYDYDRTDSEGKKRELHIEDSVNVSKIPHKDPMLEIYEKVMDQGIITRYIKNEYFSVYKYKCKGKIDVNLEDSYYLMTVVGGKGNIYSEGKTYELNSADSFVVPADVKKISFEGDLEIIASKPE